jgi:osmotically-inducible protein OsmY
MKTFNSQPNAKLNAKATADALRHPSGLLRRLLSFSYLCAQAGKRLAVAAALSGLVLGQAPVVASETDENLEASARGCYVFRQLLAEEALSIEVNNGMLTLRGTVETALQRELAEEAAAAHAGVRSVDNQITLRPVATGDADALLHRTLRIVLGWHRSSRPAVPQLEVKDGVVILRGEAVDQALRTLAAEFASGVEGVKGVTNEMTLKPAKPAGEPAESQRPVETSLGEAQTAALEVDDPSVAAQLRMALRVYGPTRSLKPGVEVREGVITLTGITATEAEREAVVRLAADIVGVRRVVDKMTAEPESTEHSHGSGAAPDHSEAPCCR